MRAGEVAATASGAWGVGTEAVLPGNASTTAPNVSINAISCPSSGDCSAVGTYVDSSGYTQGLLLTEVGGTWAAGVEAALPANAAQATNPSVFLNAASCSSPGNCAAVGGYQDNSPGYDNSQVLLMTETAGVWATGVEGALPANALPETDGNQFTDLLSVSCTSTGDCTAVGTYLLNDHVHNPAGLLFTEAGGNWGAGLEAPLPANASTSGESSADSVSCSSAGNCTAVGSYDDSSNTGQGLLLTETAGSWSTGVEATLPANADTSQGSDLSTVSCTSLGNCSAAGGYADDSDHQQLMFISETAGSWTIGVEAKLPSNSAASPLANILAISCGSVGNCAAVGNYRDNSGNEWPLLLTQTAGTWADGTEPALPANAAGDPFGGASLDSVSCPSAGNCSAVGSYNAAVGDSTNGQNLLLTESAGSWSTGTEVSLPSNGDGANGLNSVSCTAAGQCAAVGGYGVDPSGRHGLLVTTTNTPPQETLTVAGMGPGLGTVASSPSGIDCGSTCEASYDIGSVVTLAATANQNSNFEGFSGGGCAGIGACQLGLNGDTTVNADFELKSYLLTVQKSGAGSGTVTSYPAGVDCGATCAFAFRWGTQSTVTAAPDYGSVFKGWSGGGCTSTKHTCSLTVTADTTLIATFAKAQCIVPNVKHKTLAAAKSKVLDSYCKVGRITKRASTKVPKHRVIAQFPPAGRHLKRGAKVNLVVSTGKP
jgi:Divergent InlB B-repeat domain/PASTA domain